MGTLLHCSTTSILPSTRIREWRRRRHLLRALVRAHNFGRPSNTAIGRESNTTTSCSRRLSYGTANDKTKVEDMGNFSIALSGLEADSVALNTIGNNLANLNTTAYKGQTTSFEDLFYQQIGESGSGDAIQVGAGTKVSG